MDTTIVAHIIFAASLIAYLLIGYYPPYWVSQWIDSWFGWVSAVVIIVGVFWATSGGSVWIQSGITGLTVLAALQTLWYAAVATGSSSKKHKHPTFIRSWTPQPMATPMPYTLEQEMVNTLVPNHFKSSDNRVDSTYSVVPAAPLTAGHQGSTLYDLVPE